MSSSTNLSQSKRKRGGFAQAGFQGIDAGLLRLDRPEQRLQGFQAFYAVQGKAVFFQQVLADYEPPVVAFSLLAGMA